MPDKIELDFNGKFDSFDILSPQETMSDFDPYHIWLGISPQEQPAHHYRLLGITDFEVDRDVISVAAERQTVYLRTLQAGEHSVLVAQLLNEVSQARVTLLNTDQKAEYDEELRKQQTPSRPETAPVSVKVREAEAVAQAVEDFSVIQGGTRKRGGDRSSSARKIAVVLRQRPLWRGLAVLCCLLLVTLVVSVVTPNREIAESDGSSRWIPPPIPIPKAQATEIGANDVPLAGTVYQTHSEPGPVAKVRTLEGHTGWVRALAFSPEGNTLASGSLDRTIKLWDSSTGIELTTLKGHSGPVESVAFSPDGTMVASASGDSTIRLWSMKGTQLKTLEGHSTYVTCVAFSPDGKKIASASYDKTIRIWDCETGIELRRIEGHATELFTVDFSADGNMLASGGDDANIKIWNLNTGENIKTLRGASMAWFSPDGKIIVGKGWRGQPIRVWHSQTGDELRTIDIGKESSVFRLAFSPDGKIFAGGSSDGTIKLWDSQTGAELRTLVGHDDHVWSVAFSPDGTQIVSGGQDGTIKVWDLGSTPPAANTLPASLQEGLVAYYPFNGNAKDESGNGHDGIAYGTVLCPDRFGHENRSYRFNGVDNYIRVEDTELLRLSKGEFTINLWATVAAERGTAALVFKRRNGSQTGYSLGIPYETQDSDYKGKLMFSVSGGGDPDMFSEDVLSFGQWVNIAVVHSKQSGSLSIYFDGKLNSTTGEFPAPNSEATAPLFFGHDTSGQPYWFFGDMDDIRIYNRALSAAEVKALYDFEKP